jgi:hypothetical protein
MTVRARPDIWTPEGATYQGLTQPGKAGVNASDDIITYKFHFVDKRSGRKMVASVSGLASDSQQEIEDKAAEAFENWLTDIRLGPDRKRAPTKEERLEVARALREFRAYRGKRNDSTNHKLYY